LLQFYKKNKKLSLARGLLYTMCNEYYDSYHLVTLLQNRNITLVG